MKDLYQRLRVDERSDVEAIRSAIASCRDRKVAVAAKHILLVPKRKRVYDRYHQLLSTIGRLRWELSVPQSMEWESLECQDFDPKDPYDLADILNIDESLDQASDTPSHRRLRRGVYLDLNVRNIAVASIWFLVVGMLSITAAIMLTSSNKRLPSNGNVTVHRSVATDCYVNVKNSGPQHVAIDVSSPTNGLVLTILVLDGCTTKAKVPGGKHRITYSFGNASDWDGTRFRQGKKSRKINSHNMRFAPDRVAYIRIPRDE